MSPPAAPRSTELHIEELVLEGVPPGDRDAVATALRTRLTALLASGGLPGVILNGPHSSHVEVSHIDAGHLEHPPATSPTALGTQVAEALYRGLGR